MGLYFPFISQFVAGCADAIVLGVGAGLVVSGRLSTGALIAFILYIDMFFSPIQQLSQVFDSWQQTRVSVGRIADLMALETRTPAATEPVEPGRLRGEIEVGRRCGLRIPHRCEPCGCGRLGRPGRTAAAGQGTPLAAVAPDASARRPPEAFAASIFRCGRARRWPWSAKPGQGSRPW